MKYFAYGEKMFTPQLQAIVPNASVMGVAKIRGYKLFFHSKGHDDPSGKCNIIPVRDLSCEVMGVLYEIAPAERHLLDRCEHLGYGIQETTLKVSPLNDDNDNPDQFAFTYIANKENVFEDLIPFSWYKDLIISGAREHHLPEDYIKHLENMACMQDPNAYRANKQKRFLESIHS